MTTSIGSSGASALRANLYAAVSLTRQPATDSNSSTDAPATAVPDRAQTAKDARAALDQQYADAKAAGTRIVFDISQPGRPLDLSAMSDDSLAAVVNGRGFSDNEQSWAQGELGSRVQRALAPLESGNPGDLRAYQRGVRELYDNVSQDVRDALGWTPAMAAMSDKLVSGSEQYFGKLDPESFWTMFLKGQSDQHALHVARLNTRA